MSDDLAELRRVVQRIALKSHVSAAVIGRSTPSADDDIGGRRPKGGVDGRDDWSRDADGFALKSAEYFQIQLDYLLRFSRQHRIHALLKEAREALEAWERTPMPEGQAPEYGSPQWKRYIGESKESTQTLADRFNLTPRYINMVRRQYRP